MTDVAKSGVVFPYIILMKEFASARRASASFRESSWLTCSGHVRPASADASAEDPRMEASLELSRERL